MPSDDNLEGKAADVVKDLVPNAAGLAAALHPPLVLPAAILGLTQAASSAFELTKAALQRRRERRLGTYFEQIAWDHQSGKTFEAEIRGALEGDRAEELLRTIEESIRAAMDAVIDEVVPHLALLSRQHLLANRPPDRFFRSMVRILRDFEIDELKMSRSIVDAATMYGARTGQPHIRLSYRIAGAVTGESQSVPTPSLVVEGGWPADSGALATELRGDLVVRVLRRFAGEDLIREANVVGDAPFFMAEAVRLRRMAEVLCPSF